jgi:hypothetical protein
MDPLACLYPFRDDTFCKLHIHVLSLSPFRNSNSCPLLFPMKARHLSNILAPFRLRRPRIRSPDGSHAISSISSAFDSALLPSDTVPWAAGTSRHSSSSSKLIGITTNVVRQIKSRCDVANQHQALPPMTAIGQTSRTASTQDKQEKTDADTEPTDVTRQIWRRSLKRTISTC